MFKKYAGHKKYIDSKIKRLNLIIEHMREHDFLTGLSSYSLIQEKIQKLIVNPQSKNLYVIMLGLDNFNLINEVLGNKVADGLLCEVSNRIQQYLGVDALVSRKFSDEFVIAILDNSRDSFTKKIETLLLILSEPFILNQHTLFITASMGVSVYPDDATELESLLNYAYIALLNSKEIGKNNFQFFTVKLGKKAKISNQIKQTLEYALKKNELFLTYQPQVQINNHELAGFEALVRWNNQELGLIYPNEFISLAEKTGQIVPIGEWVLKTACIEAAVWQKIKTPITVAVNISNRQFGAIHIQYKNRFIQSVELALDESGLDPSLLEIEITENTIMKNDEITKKNIKKLKSLGIRLSCDDFGMGYASFNRLKEFPLDTLKIDKSLIDDMTKDSVDFLIVKAIIMIANKLKIKTIAEGVETKMQYDLLCELGCDMIQGYYIGQPLLEEQVLMLLNSSISNPR